MSCLLTFLKLTESMRPGEWVPVYFAFCALDGFTNESYQDQAVNGGIIYG